MLGSDEEKQRIADLVKTETGHIDKAIQDMAKYWDAKLVKMRSDLNVHQLFKRVDEKASHNGTMIMFEESNMRLTD